MQKIRSNLIGIDEGSFTLFSHYDTGGKMWNGSGPREVKRLITFSEPFASPPSVHVAITMWDVDHSRNKRVDYRTDAITTTDFSVIFRTWSDTKIARVRMSWRAIGEVPDPDNIWILSD